MINSKLIFPILLSVALGSGAASGAVLYSITVNGSFRVSMPYLLTASLDEVGFGELAPGGYSANGTITITNNGSQSVRLHVSASGLPTGVSMMVYKENALYLQGSQLAPDSSLSLKICLYAEPTVTGPLDTTQFQIIFSAEA